MNRFRVFALAIFVAAFPRISCAQATSSDSQTLQSLLEEVRHLRQDLQFTATTVQRMQILLYRIRAQMDAVAQARQRHDEAENSLTQVRNGREEAAAQIKQQEENRSDDPNTRKYIQQNIERMKRWLEQSTEAEPEAQAKEAQAANELRIEQSKLTDLEDQLDRLDNQLSAASQPAAHPH